MAIPLPIHSSDFNGGAMLLCTGALGPWALLPGGFTFQQSTEKCRRVESRRAAAAGSPCRLVLNPPGKPALGTLERTSFLIFIVLRINGQEHKTAFPGLTRQQSVKPALLCPPMIIMTTMPFLRI